MPVSKYVSRIVAGEVGTKPEDILAEFAARLQTVLVYPTGIVPLVGAVLQEVLDDVKTAKAKKAAMNAAVRSDKG